jgi:hypothetical protein
MTGYFYGQNLSCFEPLSPYKSEDVATVPEKMLSSSKISKIDVPLIKNRQQCLKPTKILVINSVYRIIVHTSYAM